MLTRSSTPASTLKKPIEVNSVVNCFPPSLAASTRSRFTVRTVPSDPTTGRRASTAAPVLSAPSSTPPRFDTART
jgi:hypothetical protein